MYLRDSNNLIKLESIPGENMISENYDYYSRPNNCTRSRQTNKYMILFILFIIMITVSVIAYKILF